MNNNDIFGYSLELSTLQVRPTGRLRLLVNSDSHNAILSVSHFNSIEALAEKNIIIFSFRCLYITRTAPSRDARPTRYLFTVCNSGLLFLSTTPSQPRPPSPTTSVTDNLTVLVVV